MIDNSVYVFNHLPRTGGVTVSAALASWFDPVFDYQDGPTDEARRRWLRNPLDVDRLKPGQVLIGHYTGEGALERRYPGLLSNPRVRAITFLRDPWDASLSALRSQAGAHLLTAGSDCALMSLAGWMSKALGVPLLSLRVALERYWFVGTTERLADSIAALARLVGRDAAKVEVNNASDRNLDLEISGTLRNRFRSAARSDFELHSIATRRLEESLRRLATP